MIAYYVGIVNIAIFTHPISSKFLLIQLIRQLPFGWFIFLLYFSRNITVLFQESSLFDKFYSIIIQSIMILINLVLKRLNIANPKASTFLRYVWFTYLCLSANNVYSLFASNFSIISTLILRFFWIIFIYKCWVS